MKKFNNLFMLLAAIMALSVTSARSETISDYHCDFDTNIVTSDHAFQVASNWGHNVESYNAKGAWGYYLYFVEYTYYSGAGVSGSYALKAGSQNIGEPASYWSAADLKDVNDLLVTPSVKGTISLAVKKSADNGNVRFFAINEDGTFDPTAPLKTVSSDALNTTSYTTVTFDQDNFGKIGIRAENVYIDDFKASEAEIIAEKRLSIKSFSPDFGYTAAKLYQTADKKIPVTYNVVVENIGDPGADLTQGEDGFSITLVTDGGFEIATVPVPQNLAAGETSEEFEVSGYVEEADISKVWSTSTTPVRINLRENVKQKVTTGNYYQYTAYEPIFGFRVKDSGISYNLTATQSFDIQNAAATKDYEVYNSGGAPLVIKSLAISGGFTLTPTEGFTVEPGGKTYVSVTMPGEIGNYDGDLTIVWADKDNADQTYTLHFNGKVLAEGTWQTQFRSNSYQSGYPEGSVALSGITTTYTYNAGYDHYITNSTNATEENNKFITPKLHADAGDKMTFDVKIASGYVNNIKVYLSTDRVNWGEPVADFNVTASDYESKEFSVSEAGDYYVAFALNGVYLDNIAGFKKVDVSHDLYITDIQSDEITGKELEVQKGETVNIKVQLIPVLGAAQSDYAVKLCIKDEEGNVTETSVASKDLTASATGIMQFEQDYTFDVAKSCVLKAYYTFTFTDGTTFVSPELTYTISNKPDFVFVNKAKLNSQSRPESETATIDFGKTNVAKENTDFAIWNWGGADLVLKSVETSENFTVQAFEPMTLEGKKYQILTLGFNPETSGSYDGTLTVKYLDEAGAEQTFSIPLKGTKLDNNKWFADFGTQENPAWPAGSLHESNVMLGIDSNTGNAFMRESNNSYFYNMFITPKLHAEAGETLEFSARKYAQYSCSINVYAAASREGLSDESKRTTLLSVSDLGTAFETRTVTLTEAGDYYLAFELSGVDVDDIYGLELAPATHDVQIASLLIPETAMQNVASVVKLGLRNFGLNPENDYEVLVHVGDEVTSLKPEVEIPVMNTPSAAAVSVDLNLQSPKAGTFPVYVEFKSGDYTVASDCQDVVFAEEVAGGEKTIGTFLRYSDQVPTTNYYRDSECIMIFNPDELGMSNGDRITNLKFKGYNNYTRTSVVKVYAKLVDATDLEQPAAGPYPKEDLTVIYSNDTYQWPTGGQYGNAIDAMNETLSTPLVYEAGKSLILVVESHTANPYYNPPMNYEMSDVPGKCYYACDDDPSGSIETDTKWSQNNRPVLYLTVEANPAVSTGNVADAEANGVEGATVTFISEDGDNVQYQGTTDAEGKFSVKIIQSSRTYTAIAEKDGLKDMKEGITADNMADLSFILTKWIELNEEDANLPAEPTIATVLVDLNREAGYHAVAFPVTLTDTDLKAVFGSDVETFTFEGMSGNTAWFKPSKQTEFAAGVPILVKTYAPSQRVVLEAVREVSNVANKIDKEGYSFEATYAPRALAAGEFTLSEQNWKPNNESPETPAALSNEIPTVRAYQAVLRAQDPENAPEAISFVTSDNNPVGIEGMDMENEEAVIYNLQGIRVHNPEPGMYIVNGKKVHIRK